MNQSVMFNLELIQVIITPAMSVAMLESGRKIDTILASYACNNHSEDSKKEYLHRLEERILEGLNKGLSKYIGEETSPSTLMLYTIDYSEI